jgi:hypothetical protein
MHNPNITISHLNFDDMETVQHILWYRSNAIIDNKNTEKHAGNIFMNDKVLQSRIYFVYICIPFKNYLNHILYLSEIGCWFWTLLRFHKKSIIEYIQ